MLVRYFSFAHLYVSLKSLAKSNTSLPVIHSVVNQERGEPFLSKSACFGKLS